ncbi:MAG: hypothetical protein WCD24_05875 [Serratia inhibens]
MIIKRTASVQWQLWIVAFGFFMQTLDTTIVNTALPSMVMQLSMSLGVSIALPALAFARVPPDSAPNRTLTKEPGTGSTRLQK